MSGLWDLIFSIDFGYSVLRVTTPILFAGLAAVITHKAGILNIAFDGIMLWAALLGVIGSAYTQSVIVGVICGMTAGIVIAGIMGYFSLKLKADFMLTGLALNIFASGGTVFLLYLVCNDKGVSNSLQSLIVPKIDIPILKDISVIGPILSGHNILTYVSLLCVFLVWLLINKTAIGLRIKAVGENPNAAESVGVKVIRIKFIALLLSGLVASLGGVYMSMGYLPFFTRNMVAGRGFIGLAAQSLGGGNPVGTLFASFVFGAADALSNMMQTLRVPAEFIQVIPYVATLIGLVIFSVSKRRSALKKIKLNKIDIIKPSQQD
jgi:simple sugar transport system permease protein